MSLACPRLGSALLLPFRCLPTPQFPKTLWLPTVPLVIPPCLEPPAASLPQTTSPPQPTLTGRNTPANRKMPMSHGRVCSLGAARGGVASSPGTPLSAHDSAHAGRAAPVAHLTAHSAEGHSPTEQPWPSAHYQDGRGRRRKQGRRRLRYARPGRRLTKERSTAQNEPDNTALFMPGPICGKALKEFSQRYGLRPEGGT